MDRRTGAAQSSGSAFHVAALRYGYSLQPIGIDVTKRRRRKDDAEEEEEGEEIDDDDDDDDGDDDLDTARQAWEDAFSGAEDSFRSESNRVLQSLLLHSNVLDRSGRQDRKNEVDEGAARTKVRALLASTQPYAFLEDDDYDEQGTRTRAKLDNDRIFVGHRHAQVPMSRYEVERKQQQGAVRFARYEKRKKQKRAKVDDEDVDADGSSEEEREEDVAAARKLSAETQSEIDKIVSHMPSSSLMETLHNIASHYYDARGLLLSRVVKKKRASREGQEATEERDEGGEQEEQTEQEETLTSSHGMLRSCEGSALVAIATFIEELAKYEAGLYDDDDDKDELSSEKDDETSQNGASHASDDDEHVAAAMQRLEELRARESKLERKMARKERRAKRAQRDGVLLLSTQAGPAKKKQKLLPKPSRDIASPTPATSRQDDRKRASTRATKQSRLLRSSAGEEETNSAVAEHAEAEEGSAEAEVEESADELDEEE